MASTATRRRKAVSPVTAYAEAVVGGDIIAGNLIRLACQRHLTDLNLAPSRGLHFDPDAAQKVINFFPLLLHHKGEWGGQPFNLAPWQQFLIGSIFGWKREDDLRRYRYAYIECPRKQGKSSLAAGVGLYLAFFDGEPGAECYSAATKREQAKIVWEEAKRTVLKTPGLRKRITPLAGNLHSVASASKFQPLGADEDTMDGLNIHGAIIDELHAHKQRGVWDVLETATSARRQPLIFAITTAGYSRNTICWEQHDYAEKLLTGVLTDDTYFAFIAAADPEDDWTDPLTWQKANPNYGVSVKPDDLAAKAERAREMPSAQNPFKRLHLNIWTNQEDRWLDLGVWDENAGNTDPDELLGRECWAGLDLSSTTDITALELVFPDDAGGYDALSFFWAPEESIDLRARRDRVPYPLWRDQGHLGETPGNVVDYDFVRQTINELGIKYNIREIAIDRWNSTQLQTQLMGDGFTVVPFGQGFASMTAPSKEAERLLLERKLRHGGNPVLRWMANNVAVLQDSAGNIKPAKDKSTGRIDGIVALVMAIGRASVANRGGSVYDRGASLFL